MPARLKSLTLPDGSKCQVIAPNRFSRMTAGPPPKSLVRSAGKKEAEADREYTQPELDWLVRSQKALLLHCVSPIQQPDGAWVRLVDKPFADVGTGELAIAQLDDATLDILTKTINELDGEVAASAATFPAPSVTEREDLTRPAREAVCNAAEPPPRFAG